MKIIDYFKLVQYIKLKTNQQHNNAVYNANKRINKYL